MEDMFISTPNTAITASKMPTKPSPGDHTGRIKNTGIHCIFTCFFARKFFLVFHTKNESVRQQRSEHLSGSVNRARSQKQVPELPSTSNCNCNKCTHKNQRPWQGSSHNAFYYHLHQRCLRCRDCFRTKSPCSI